MQNVWKRWAPPGLEYLSFTAAVFTRVNSKQAKTEYLPFAQIKTFARLKWIYLYTDDSIPDWFPKTEPTFLPLFSTIISIPFNHEF